MATRPGQPAKPGRAVSTCTRPRCRRTRARIAARQPLGLPVHLRADLILAADHGAGRGRRGGRAVIGHEVGDREVGLVPDGGDYRDRARRNRACHDLFVERPEILDRPASAPDDDDVHTGYARDGLQPARHVGGGAVSLHAGGPDDEVRVRIARVEHGHDVAHGGAIERGDDADLARQEGKRALPCRRKQAFRFEPALQLLEGDLQRTGARRLQPVADDLVLALDVVHADPARVR